MSFDHVRGLVTTSVPSGSVSLSHCSSMTLFDPLTIVSIVSPLEIRNLLGGLWLAEGAENALPALWRAIILVWCEPVSFD